jgi:hypothetical protein
LLVGKGHFPLFEEADVLQIVDESDKALKDMQFVSFLSMTKKARREGDRIGLE